MPCLLFERLYFAILRLVLSRVPTPWSLAPEPQDQQGEVSEDEGESAVFFNVSVVKGDNALVFECESDGEFVEIRHVSYEPKDGVESEAAYTGPVFEELDDSLQDEFLAYLSDRGINEELGEYLRHLVYDKEQIEYARWLKNVQAFAGGK